MFFSSWDERPRREIDFYYVIKLDDGRLEKHVPEDPKRIKKLPK